MNTLTIIVSCVTGLAAVAAIFYKCFQWAGYIIEGLRCSLRSDMLDIYYECVETKIISQYKAEHFEKCYYAYKALHGNSFIDEIHEQAMEWKVVV